MKKECLYAQGFTLIELIVVIMIIAVLSGVILFSVTQYINKGKDSNISANLAVLMPAGEAYYNIGSTYSGFCDSYVVSNATKQMPPNVTFNCYVDTNLNGQSWAACAIEFSDNLKAFCVDSRGVKTEISSDSCNNTIAECQ